MSEIVLITFCVGGLHEPPQQPKMAPEQCKRQPPIPKFDQKRHQGHRVRGRSDLLAWRSGRQASPPPRTKRSSRHADVARVPEPPPESASEQCKRGSHSDKYGPTRVAADNSLDHLCSGHDRATTFPDSSSHTVCSVPSTDSPNRSHDGRSCSTHQPYADASSSHR